jgi:gliding motility-associated-like protein
MQKLFFTVALYAATLSGGLAQDAFFNARLTLKKVDCIDKRVQMDVEIRSVQKDAPFYLGDANFRFGYDGRLLSRPAIVQQHNFSREAANGQEYGVQNLNGSSENIAQGLLSLNVFYTGSGQKSQKVTLEWMSIATIQFDIANTSISTPSQVLWYTPQTFPKSGLSEVVANGNEFQLKVVKSGSFSNATIPVISEACPNLSSNSSSGPSVTTKPPILTPSDPLVTVPDPDPITNVSIGIEDDDLVIPEGFSPNGDGVNDVFALRNKKGIKINLQIYNRLGVLVYTNADYRNDWDGLDANGKGISEGTYFYVIKTADGQNYRRALTIAR